MMCSRQLALTVVFITVLLSPVAQAAKNQLEPSSSVAEKLTTGQACLMKMKDWIPVWADHKNGIKKHLKKEELKAGCQKLKGVSFAFISECKHVVDAFLEGIRGENPSTETLVLKEMAAYRKHLKACDKLKY